MPIESLPHPPPKGIDFHRLFKKDWKKIQNNSARKKFISTILDCFFIDPFHRSLRNHSVGTAYIGCRSIDVTGDIRALYTINNNNTVVFLRIGTHSHLYG